MNERIGMIATRPNSVAPTWPLIAGAIFCVSCTLGPSVPLPGQSDWSDRGVVLEAGASGEWDARLNGMLSPCGVIKQADTYFLYYIGADGDRADPWTDNGPRHRKLGVATSTDGINFEKYAGNPIIESQVHPPNQEEGVFSCAVTRDSNDRTILYWGEMEARSAESESVDGDAVLSISVDGFTFSRVGDVVQHDDPSVWGRGDEIFPVGTFERDGVWHVYYVAKSRRNDWDIGIAWGSQPNSLPFTSKGLRLRHRITGDFNVNFVTPETFVVMMDVRDGDRLYQQVRVAQTGRPARFSRRIVEYDFGEIRVSSTYYDAEIGRWMMYYIRTGEDVIRLRTAQQELR